MKRSPILRKTPPPRPQDLLVYEAETGLFVWAVDRTAGVRAGDIAGCRMGSGYVAIKVGGKMHKAHRLAWLFVHGAWPAGHIDHINGIKHDNRIINLRCVTNAVNMQNQRRAMASNKSSGLLGVHVSGKKWRARIVIDGKRRHIGCFDTPEQAHAAYLITKRDLHVGCSI